MRKLLVFGKAAKDYIVTDFPFQEFNQKIKRKETNSVGEISEYWGGSGLNVAAASSFPSFSATVKTVLFTQTGNPEDPDTISLKTICERLGISLESIEESYIPKICVLVESGRDKDRTFLSGSNGEMSIKINKLLPAKRQRILEHARDASAVVLAGLTPDNPFASMEMVLLLKEMKKQNPELIIALDLIASDFGEAQVFIFGSADYLLPSDEELPLLMSSGKPKDALQKELEKAVIQQDVRVFDRAAEHIFERFQTLKLLGIKRGKAGSRVYKKMQGNNAPLRFWSSESIAEERIVKDTTGAGDSWIGAFMASEIMSHNPGQSAACGNVIARYCISELGAIDWRNAQDANHNYDSLVKIVPGQVGPVN
jgi:sugar/nucleoside kinase (ribokinase family)